MISNEILERIRVLPPQQQAQMMDLITVNQTKSEMEKKVIDRQALDDFMENVSSFVGISNNGSIK